MVKKFRKAVSVVTLACMVMNTTATMFADEGQNGITVEKNDLARISGDTIIGSVEEGEYVFSISSGMRPDEWSPNSTSNALVATDIDGVYMTTITVPASGDGVQASDHRFSLSQFDEYSNKDYSRILLGVPQDKAEVTDYSTGDLTNIRVELGQTEKTATVYFDSKTYGIAILDESGKRVNYEISWVGADDDEVFMTPEEYAELTVTDYVAMLNSTNCLDDLEICGIMNGEKPLVAGLPDFVLLRDQLEKKVKGETVLKEYVYDFSDIPESTYVVGNSTYTYKNLGTNIQIVGFENTKDTVVSVPQKIDNLSVTEIAEGAFAGCETIQTITLPSTISVIGERAFAGCKGLKSFSFPAKISEVPEGMFMGCESLTSVNFYGDVTTIGARAFKDCTSIENFVFPEKLTTIGVEAFFGCSSLKGVNIPAKVSSIGKMAFASCSAIETMTVDSANTTYDSRDNCNAIIKTTVEVTDLVSSSLISGCKNTVVPNSILIIENSAFYGNEALTSITLPVSVKQIAASAFENCTSLTNVDINFTVFTIGARAFMGCTSLENIVLPSRLKFINVDVFSGCTGLKSISIPANVTGLDSRAFSGCTSLESVTFEGNPGTIGDEVFKQCKKLSTITLPDSITQIGEYVFEESGLKEITLPANVTSLPAFVFAKCDKLEKVNFPEGFTTIGSVAFGGCTSLKTMIIPDTVTCIYSSAFYGCTNLEAVEIPGNVSNITYNAFDECPILAIYCDDNTPAATFAATYNIPYGSVSDFNERNKKYTDGTAEYTYSILKNKIFITSYKNTGTGKIDLIMPDSIESKEIQYIAKHFFSGCNNLRSVTLSKGIKCLPYRTFENCANLLSIWISDGTQTVVNDCIYNCRNVNKIYVSESVNEIKQQLMSGTSIDLVIYGKSGSYAQTYAAENRYSFTTAGQTVFEVTANVDKTKASVGQSITLTPGITGGNGNVKYQYIMTVPQTGKRMVLKDFSGASSYTGKLTSEGEKIFCIKAEDETGRVVISEDIKVVVGNAAALSGTLMVNGGTGTVNTTEGATAKLTVSAKDGSAPYEYQYVMKNVNSGQTIVLKDYSSSASYDAKLVNAGTKVFYVNVRDSQGNVEASNAVTVVVEKSTLKGSLKVNGSSQNITVDLGENVKLDVSATGGSGSYTYQYLIKNVSTGKTYVLKNYSTAKSFTGPLTSMGNKIFTVNVKDSTGAVVASNSVTVTVSNVLKGSLTVNDKSGTISLGVGGEVVLKPTAKGGAGGYTYQYVMKNMSTGKEMILKDYSKDSEYTGKISSLGVKVFAVNIKDAEGTIVATNSVTVVVSNQELMGSLKVNNSNTTLTLTKGQTVNLVAAASGGTGSGKYTYKFVIKNVKTGQSIALTNFKSSSSYSGPLTSTGTKIFTVYVKDSYGVVVASNEVTVVVK